MTIIHRCVFTAAALIILAISPPVQAKPEVGKAAPAFIGTDTKGQAIDLTQYRGKTVILEWTNHDCPFVRKHYGAGNMQKTQKAARDDGIVWLSVISSAPGRQGHVDGTEADRLTASRGALPHHVLLDPKGTIGQDYEAKTTPHMYIVDAKGILRYRGAIDSIPTANPSDIKDAVNYVRLAMRQMKLHAKVKPSVTRAYGCSVKYSW